MLFRHRHYVAIAALLADLEQTDAPDDIRKAFANLFQRDYHKFDRDRFLAAAAGTPTNGRDRVRHAR